MPSRDPFTGRAIIERVRLEIDEATLTGIAEETGGKYFRATDTQSLESIYAEIDAMEKTKVESRSFVDYRELAVQPLRVRGWTIPPLLSIALFFLVGRVLLGETLFRSLP